MRRRRKRKISRLLKWKPKPRSSKNFAKYWRKIHRSSRKPNRLKRTCYASNELELTIETRVQGNLAEIRTKAQNEAQDALKLKLSEKDQQMAAMHKTIEELKRKAEQGSQQSQGEVFELEL